MNDFDNIVKRMTVTRLEPGDYTGEDGLLYCGKCHTPKQFRMEKPPLEGRPLPCPCQCEQERIDRETAEQVAASKIVARWQDGHLSTQWAGGQMSAYIRERDRDRDRERDRDR